MVVEPSSVYRMAELARTLGERRLCKLEVELMTLKHYVYCTEHEPLQGVLSHVTSMVSLKMKPIEVAKLKLESFISS